MQTSIKVSAIYPCKPKKGNIKPLQPCNLLLLLFYNILYSNSIVVSFLKLCFFQWGQKFTKKTLTVRTKQICVTFFVRNIVSTPLFFLFRSNIMHLTDIVSWGKLNHLIKVSTNPKLTVLHNFGFLYDSINLWKSFLLKKKSTKNVIRTGSYLAKTILLPLLF